MKLRPICLLLALLAALMSMHRADAEGSTLLLSTSGVGEDVTGVFDSASGHIAICYSTAGRSPGGSLGPSVNFSFQTTGPIVQTNRAEQRCVDRYIAPARYFIHVFATDWSAWRLDIYDLDLSLPPPPSPSQARPANCMIVSISAISCSE